MNYLDPEAIGRRTPPTTATLESEPGVEAMSIDEQLTYSVSAKTDIWALGCMVCQLVTGSTPFPACEDRGNLERLLLLRSASKLDCLVLCRELRRRHRLDSRGAQARGKSHPCHNAPWGNHITPRLPRAESPFAVSKARIHLMMGNICI